MDLQKYTRERIMSNAVEFDSFSYLNNYQFVEDRVVRIESSRTKPLNLLDKTNRHSICLPSATRCSKFVHAGS